MSNICAIMNDVKKEINKNIADLEFFYGGEKNDGLWNYIAKIQQDKFILLSCNKKIVAKSIKVRNIFNWLSLQITTQIDLDHYKHNSENMITDELPQQYLPYFSENKSILQYNTQYIQKNTSNMHKYESELFAVYMKPKSENCSMQSQAALSTLMNTFDYHPIVVDLTSCNILPPEHSS